jgi:hypothetical protein
LFPGLSWIRHQRGIRYIPFIQILRRRQLRLDSARVFAVTGSPKAAMHEHLTQPHYAPASVGALMDPAFLRGAMLDAEGGRRAESTSPPATWPRWRTAVHAVTAFFRRY